MPRFHPSVLTSRSGQTLAGDWKSDAGLSAVRDVYRMCKRYPRGSPLREVAEKWERSRAAAGPEFAVPPDWAP